MPIKTEQCRVASEPLELEAEWLEETKRFEVDSMNPHKVCVMIENSTLSEVPCIAAQFFQPAISVPKGPKSIPGDHRGDLGKMPS